MRLQACANAPLNATGKLYKKCTTFKPAYCKYVIFFFLFMDIVKVLFNCFAPNTKTNSLYFENILDNNPDCDPENHSCSTQQERDGGEITAALQSQSSPRYPPSSPSGLHDRSAVQDVCSHPCTMLLSCEPNEGTHLRSVSRKKKSCCQCAVALTSQICCRDFFPCKS